jgi:hypothetical protein
MGRSVLRRLFRRTWVMQEMCLARELVLLLSSARLDWSDVATVVLYMYIFLAWRSIW